MLLRSFSLVNCIRYSLTRQECPLLAEVQRHEQHVRRIEEAIFLQKDRYTPTPQVIFHLPNTQQTVMKDRCRQQYAGPTLQDRICKMLEFPGPPGCHHRNRHCLRDRFGKLQVIPCLGPITIHTGRQYHARPKPSHCFAHSTASFPTGCVPPDTTSSNPDDMALFRRASIATVICSEPNFAAASLISAGRLTATLFMETLPRLPPSAGRYLPAREYRHRRSAGSL